MSGRLEHHRRVDQRFLGFGGALDVRAAMAPPIGYTGADPDRQHDPVERPASRVLDALPPASLTRSEVAQAHGPVCPHLA